MTQPRASAMAQSTSHSDIALIIQYLREEISNKQKIPRGTMSNSKLKDGIDKALKDKGQDASRITPNLLWRLSATAGAPVIADLEVLAAKYKLDITPFLHSSGAAARADTDRSRETDDIWPSSKLGETAVILEGIWKICYIAPILPNMTSERHIRESLLFFRNIGDAHCELLYVSSWKRAELYDIEHADERRFSDSRNYNRFRQPGV